VAKEERQKAFGAEMADLLGDTLQPATPAPGTDLNQLLFESSPDCVKILDVQGRLCQMNRNGRRAMEIADLDVLRGKPWRMFWPPEARGSIDAAVRAAGAGRTSRFSAFCPTARGTAKWWDVTVNPVLDDDASVVAILSVSRDITALQEATERAIRNANEAQAERRRLDALLEATPVGITYADASGELEMVNAANRELWGGRVESRRVDEYVQWKGWWADGSPRHGQRIAPEEWGLARALRGEDVPGDSIEIEPLDAPGTRKSVLLRASAVRDAEGRVTGAVVAQMDLSDRARMEAQLREADRRKDEFLAMLAHELRNPLAPISTAAELLRLSISDPKRVARASEIITRQARHMTDLVNDLLDVSRVTRGLIELMQATLDLKDAIRAAIEQVRPLLESRGHRLSTHMGDHALWVRGDRTRLIQIISNILANAAKYTPNGGVIALRADRHEGMLRIEVEDNGNGIDARLLPHIFDLFTQAERNPDRSQGGLGIGLALVRSLVALHGGQVAARSPGKGRGSTFTLRFPPASPPMEATRSNTEGTAEPRPQRIVLVDDNQDAAQTLATLLEAHGHAVAVFGTAEALLAAHVPDPDTYILDIGLPGITGLELAQRLRASGSPEVRLLALSGYGQDQDRAASCAAGFDEHFVKPVPLDQLLASLGGREKHRA
jgi:PAS domain S-box-containing protein